MTRKSLSFRSYLSSVTITLSAITILILYLALILSVSGIPVELILITAAGSILIVAVWLACGFFMKKKRIDILYRKMDSLHDKYLIGELMDVPTDAVERMYFDIMKEISRSAIGAVERAEQEKLEYCDFVESWVHEIKTPLTACSLILVNDADPGKLKREIKRADNETENILYYARLRTYEKDIQIKPVSVKNVIEASLHNEMELLIAAHISVEMEGDFTVNTDSKQLEFIIKQFLINCAKYCSGCCIRITAYDSQVSVEDNGPGIPAHELPRVFQRGFTGAKWRTTGTGTGTGTGMGLYIVSELCKRLNISLDVQSVEGEYTRFILTF